MAVNLETMKQLNSHNLLNRAKWGILDGGSFFLSNYLAFLMQSTQNNIQIQLEVFNNFSLQTSDSINELWLQNILSEQINFLNEISFDLTVHMKNIIVALNFAKKHILHPKVITPLKLLRELLKIYLEIDQQFLIALHYTNIQ